MQPWGSSVASLGQRAVSRGLIAIRSGPGQGGCAVPREEKGARDERVVPSRGRGAAGGGLNGCGRVRRAIPGGLAGGSVAYLPTSATGTPAAAPSLPSASVTSRPETDQPLSGTAAGVTTQIAATSTHLDSSTTSQMAPSSNPRASSSRAVSADGSCVARDAQGELIWVGSASPELALVGDALERMVDGQPDSLTGVSYCSRYDGVAIYGRSYSAATSATKRSLADDHPAIPIFINSVPNSLSELLAAEKTIAGHYRTSADLTSINPDVTTGGIDVYLNPQAAVAGSAASVRAVAATIQTLVGSDVPVHVQVGNPPPHV